MQNVWVCDVVAVLAFVLKPAWCAVVAVTDNRLVLDYQCSNLASLTIAVLSSYAGHAQIACVKQALFFC